MSTYFISHFEVRFPSQVPLFRNDSSGAWNTISLALWWAILGTVLRALLATFQISANSSFRPIRSGNDSLMNSCVIKFQKKKNKEKAAQEKRSLYCFSIFPYAAEKTRLVCSLNNTPLCPTYHSQICPLTIWWICPAKDKKLLVESFIVKGLRSLSCTSQLKALNLFVHELKPSWSPNWMIFFHIWIFVSTIFFHVPVNKEI